jgi:hypothetical protein
MSASKIKATKKGSFAVDGIGTLRCRHSICINLVDIKGACIGLTQFSHNALIALIFGAQAAKLFATRKLRYRPPRTRTRYIAAPHTP